MVWQTRSLVALALVLGLAACDKKQTTDTGEPTGEHMSITTPGNTVAGTPFDVVVKDLDASGNLATGSSAVFSLVVGNHPDSATALAGVLTKPASGGVVDFAGLSLMKVGTYTLMVTSSGLTPATSGVFTIIPGPQAKLRVSGPMTVQAGANFTWIITVVDASGNTVDYNGTVGLSLPTSSSAKLSGTAAVVAVHGVAQITVSVSPPGTYPLSVFNAGLLTTDTLVVN